MHLLSAPLVGHSSTLHSRHWKGQSEVRLMWEHANGFEKERGECVSSGAGNEVREVRGEQVTQGLPVIARTQTLN